MGCIGESRRGPLKNISFRFHMVGARGSSSEAEFQVAKPSVLVRMRMRDLHWFTRLL